MPKITRLHLVAAFLLGFGAGGGQLPALPGLPTFGGGAISQQLPATPAQAITLVSRFSKPNVLIVEESADRNSLSEDQRNILTAQDDSSLIAFVRKRGGAIEVLDKDEPSVNDQPQWVQDAWKSKGSSTPWIVAKGGN